MRTTILFLTTLLLLFINTTFGQEAVVTIGTHQGAPVVVDTQHGADRVQVWTDAKRLQGEDLSVVHRTKTTSKKVEIHFLKYPTSKGPGDSKQASLNDIEVFVSRLNYRAANVEELASLDYSKELATTLQGRAPICFGSVVLIDEKDAGFMAITMDAQSIGLQLIKDPAFWDREHLVIPCVKLTP